MVKLSLLSLLSLFSLSVSFNSVAIVSKLAWEIHKAVLYLRVA